MPKKKAIITPKPQNLGLRDLSNLSIYQIKILNTLTLALFSLGLICYHYNFLSILKYNLLYNQN